MTSAQQIKFTCESLINARKFERLKRFLWALSTSKPDTKKEEIFHVAQAYIAYHNGDFAKLYEVLRKHVYSKGYHQQLQTLWCNARYIEAEQKRGKTIGAVEKYRVRKKYPLPRTIWDGEPMSTCFETNVRNTLTQAYLKNSYPSSQEKLQIAVATKLTVTQVSNWFKNKRQRDKAVKTKTKCQKEENGSKEEKNSNQSKLSLARNEYQVEQYVSTPLQYKVYYIKKPIQFCRPMLPTYHRMARSSINQSSRIDSFPFHKNSNTSYHPTVQSSHYIRYQCTCCNRNDRSPKYSSYYSMFL